MHELINQKNAKQERPIEIVIIIKPSCLKVDKAIILFKPNSKFAPWHAINIVKLEINNKATFRQYLKAKCPSIAPADMSNTPR